MKTFNNRYLRVAILALAWLLHAHAASAAGPATQQQLEKCQQKETLAKQIKCACEEIVGGTFVDYSDDGTNFACWLPDGRIYECYYGVGGQSCHWIPAELLDSAAASWFIGAVDGADGYVSQSTGSSGSGATHSPYNGATHAADWQGEGGDSSSSATSDDAFVLPEIGGEVWSVSQRSRSATVSEPFAYLADAPLDYLWRLLELQQMGIVRGDVPIANYIDLQSAQASNLNVATDDPEALPMSPMPLGGMCAPVMATMLPLMVIGLTAMRQRRPARRLRRVM